MDSTTFFLLFIGVAVLLIMIIGNANAGTQQNKLRSKINEIRPRVRVLENDLKIELEELGKWFYTCKRCQNDVFVIKNITTNNIEVFCNNCGSKRKKETQNTFYRVDPIPNVYKLFWEDLYELVYDTDILKKSIEYLQDPAFVKAGEPAHEFYKTLNFNYRKINQTKKRITWQYDVSCLSFVATGYNMDLADQKLKSKKIGKLNTGRPKLDKQIEEDWSYKKITTGSKANLIKRWAKKTNLKCPDGSKCGGIEFSKLDNSEITFGHILPQSWAKEFPHFYSKVHHPDNLYLSCKSCNSSLNNDFPYKELKKRITEKVGTIGDWLRNHVDEMNLS